MTRWSLPICRRTALLECHFLLCAAAMAVYFVTVWPIVQRRNRK